jgi:hypothetical protein
MNVLSFFRHKYDGRLEYPTKKNVIFNEQLSFEEVLGREV